MTLPSLFLARMEQMLGEDYPAFFASYADPPRFGLRINVLKVAPQRFLEFSPFTLQPLPWTEMGFLIKLENDSPGKHPYHAAGLYYLQEPSAMAVAEALAPLPGEKVLDLAAAPGGKTTHLAALMQGEGLLVANEIHRNRVWDLAENVERWGAKNVVITNETPEHLANHFGAYFDRVLLDAPCSGEGLFRKTPASRTEWSEALVQACSLRQSSILSHAAQMVRPGGWMVYSTCTFAPQENETVVARFLNETLAKGEAIFELRSINHICGLEVGRENWADEVITPNNFHLARAARIWPHHSPGEGHFIALLQRVDSIISRTMRFNRKVFHPPEAQQSKARELYRAFCQETFENFPFEEPPILQGTYLYHHAPITPAELHGLRVIHPGVWLGTVKKERFEPAHALSLASHSCRAKRTFSLDPDSPECMAYLRGETLPAHLVGGTGNGWTIVSVTAENGSQQFPLGWARRQGEQLKNSYPKGLRRLS